MPKMHEVLAVASAAGTQAEKCRSDLATTFDKKKHLFAEKLLTFQSNAEGVAPVTETQSSLQSTVRGELAWLANIWSKAIDADATIDFGNQNARADVVLDNGATLLKDVPATALLQLEKTAEAMRQLIIGLPTLDPTKGFTPDTTRQAGVYVAREERKFRGRKEQVPIVLYPATPEHPAQTQLITQDVIVGTLIEREWSGLITPAEKATMMERVEEFKRAVKQARARANDATVAAQEIGGLVLSYVFGTEVATKRV